MFNDFRFGPLAISTAVGALEIQKRRSTMEEEVKRWSVTYTKHMKQKRKVYQDGFLALYTKSRKVKLYDESESVLEIRMLTSDEVVKAGETLTFHSHIVVVEDCEGSDDKTSLSNVKNDNRGKTVSRNFGVRPAKKFRSPICVDSSKIKIDKDDEAPAVNQSASQKLIKEFKKAELQKYAVTKGSPVSDESSVTEWTALYSTQTMKKAKVYQDGYISLVYSGLQGRKVMLYDQRRTLLDSRFLKSDELLKYGDSLSFDGHIVEIGDLEMKMPKDNIALKEINSKCVKELIDSHGLKKSLETNPTVVPVPDKSGSSAELSDKTNSIPNGEWIVLYTNQLTQKAKKFHDGFLSLTHYGSQRKLLLYDTSRRLLDSRFLKRDEYICSNETFLFDGHLVNVGEPKESELETQKKGKEVLREIRSISGHQGFVKASETLISNPNVSNLTTSSHDKIHTVNGSPIEEAFPMHFFLGHDEGSVVGRSCTDDNSSSTVPTNKPLRDVSGILSSLQRPSGNEKSIPKSSESSRFQSPFKKRPDLGT